MITIEVCRGIEGIAYLADLKRHAENEQRGLKAGVSSSAMAAALKKAGAADEVTAYLDGSKKAKQDNGAQQAESPGVLIVLGEIPEPDLDKWKQSKRKKKAPPKKVAEFGKTGDHLSFEEAVLLGKGHHNKTGERLVQNNKGEDANRTVGNDVGFHAPKSVSVVWGQSAAAAYRGDAEGLRWKNAIEQAQDRAVKRALRYAHENGLFIARRSDKKFGHEGAGVSLFGNYRHFTSREGDPQLHDHNMWFNVCVRSDGTTGTNDNAKLKAHIGVMGALYRMELANGLREELGVRVSKVDRNFEIDGVPDELIETFSKRRAQVEDYLEAMGIDDTANHREASKHASRNTRKSKDEQPPLTELYGRWEGEAKEKGWTFETLTENVSNAAEKKTKDEAEDWIKARVAADMAGDESFPEERPAFDLAGVKARAYAAVVETSSAFAERRILKSMFEELQVYTNVDTAEKIVADFIGSGELITLPGKIKDDEYFTTAEIARIEQGLLKDAYSMLSNLKHLNKDLVDQHANAPLTNPDGSLMILPNGQRAYLKPEQKAAVKRACGDDQIVVIHGSAGAGKSKLAEKVAAIHRAEGREVHAIAPSHKAKEVVANDAQIELEMARAVAGFIAGYEKGKFKLDDKSTLIVDEAGMIGLDDMTKLVGIAKATGARIILSGDKYQLPSIARGAPLAMLAKDEVCGCAVLIDIVRQKDPRQREASVNMALGKTAEGLKHYVDTGRVKFTDTAEVETLKAYMRDREENPNGTRMMGVFRNAHATSLNLKTVAALKASGAIAPVGVKFDAWTRGLNQRKLEREFCERGRIIFGESFKVGDVEISNNTTATIDRIVTREGEEPLLTITTDNGVTFTATPSQMVGYRDEKAKDKTTPKIDHAYAQTVYSLQGSTFDRMFVYAGEAGNSELAYVMMTRHKNDCQVFVDRRRIYDELAAKAGMTMQLSKKTGAAPEEHMKVTGEPTDEEIKQNWVKENSVSGRKLNACDFYASTEEFMKTNFSTAEKKKELAMNEEKTPNEANAYENAKGVETQSAPRRPMPRGVGRIGSEPKPEVKAEPVKPSLAQEALNKLNTGRAANAIKRAKTEGERRREIEDRNKRESDWLNRDANLVDYAMSKGAYIKKGTEKSYILNRDIGTEYTLTWGEGRGLVITKRNNGLWQFWDRSSGVGGNIVNFYQFCHNLPIGTKNSPNPKSYKTAMDALRQEFGLSTRDLSKSSASYSPADLTPKLVGRELHEANLAKIKDYDRDKIGRVERGYNMGLPIRAGERYSIDLLSRAIGTTTQEKLSAQGVLKIENPKWNDIKNVGTREKPVWEKIPNKNVRGWIVKMQSAWHSLTGYIRKGPDGEEPGKRFSMNAPSSQRALVAYGNVENPTRFLLDESISDSFTRYEREQYRADTMYLATAGQPKDVEAAMVYDLAKRHPGAEWALGAQNDAANERFRQTMTAAINEGDDTAKIVTLTHSAEFKDINEQHKAENADRIKTDLAKYGQIEQPTEAKPVSSTPENGATRPVPQRPQNPVARPVAGKPEPVAPVKRPVPQKPEEPRSKWKPAQPMADAADRRRQLEEEQQRRDQELANRPKGPSR